MKMELSDQFIVVSCRAALPVGGVIVVTSEFSHSTQATVHSRAEQQTEDNN